MIKARHSVWAESVFTPYMNRLIKKNFSAFYLVNDFPEIPAGRPLVVAPNHISWWDGFFARYAFSNFIKRKMHIMMLEEQLNRYRFFSRLGAFSVDPKNPKSIIQTAAYTQEVLKNFNNYVVAYPQGQIEAFEKYPLSLKRGLKFFLNGADKNCVVLPVAFKIQYYNKKYPAVLLRFGELTNAENLISNYDDFISRFHENITLLTEATFYQNFKTNLFNNDNQ